MRLSRMEFGITPELIHLVLWGHFSTNAANRLYLLGTFSRVLDERTSPSKVSTARKFRGGREPTSGSGDSGPSRKRAAHGEGE